MPTDTYTFDKTLPDVGIEDALARTRSALQAEGFGVLTEIDVKETLKSKIGADVDDYVILGACNPTLARRALDAEPHVGLLLPCNVVVQERLEGGVVVSILDPRTMTGLVDNPAIEPVAVEAEQRLKRVLEALDS